MHRFWGTGFSVDHHDGIANGDHTESNFSHDDDDDDEDDDHEN
jgi:hypothetical protein